MSMSFRHRTLLSIALLLSVVLVCGEAIAHAQQVPQQITYQGTLADADGAPVNDPVDLTFRFYNGLGDGAAQLPQGSPWVNEFTAVPVNSGRFAVLLGSGDRPRLPEALLDSDGPLWLEVTVATDGGAGEALPRTQLTSTAFALRAEQAQRVADGAAVRSLNELTDAVTLSAGANVTIDQGSGTLTISSTDTGITSVTSNGTLTGEGTSDVPLGLADEAVTPAKLAEGAAVRGLNVADSEGTSLGQLADNVTVQEGDNVTLSADAEVGTLTISAAAPEGGISSVSSDGTLTGNGTSTAPLSLADKAVAPNKLADGAVVRSLAAEESSGATITTLTDAAVVRAGDRIVLGQQNGAITISVSDDVPSSDEVLTSVSSDGTLTGDGTGSSPLSLNRNAVTSANIAPGEVKSDDIGSGAVVETKLLDGAVSAPKLSPEVPEDGDGDQVLAYSDASNELVWQDPGLFRSSIRWKDNVQTLDDPMALVERLRGVRYDWKESGQTDIGMIAEEVAEVFPELVNLDDEGQPRGVQYAKLTAVLIEALKTQQKELEAARREAGSLEKRVARLERILLQSGRETDPKPASDAQRRE